ncbi:hypothetical protein [Bacillus sp. 1NLA3E]|uniref:hypothetical protein n=1 Tax=Bacillus sp. 1NLA3E TaxID=666686 RepID=UPI000247EC24|nr:hypothetical protein [Bacillus sp. 1NLA3E]AGK52349.1 hypothetical protein B1NLA3E_02845 [Bacillus sp. 1NLA3E]
MKKGLIPLVFILLSFTLLTSCNSQKDIDQQVKDYVKEKYKFNVAITYREGKNEGNMGDRIFQVIKNSQPKIEFHVYLSGVINPKIQGDDYPEQKKAYEYSQQFFKENTQKIKRFGYDQIKFSASANGLDVSVVTNQEVSSRDQNSLERLLEFVQIVNRFKEDSLRTETISSIIIHHKNSQNKIVVNGINSITDSKILTQQLNKDAYFVNKALFQRDKALFQSMEKDIKEIGYSYKYGLNVGMVKETIFCNEDNIKNGECFGGYDLTLEGPRDSKSLYQLAQTLKSQDIKIKDVFLPEKPSLLIENIDKITSPQQIDLILDRK